METIKKGDKVTIKATGKKHIVCYASTTLIDNFAFLYELDGFNIVEDFREFEFDELEHSKDSLIEFLDNNPPEATEEAKELTQEQKELVWQADLDAHNRQIAEQNTFHQ